MHWKSLENHFTGFPHSDRSVVFHIPSNQSIASMISMVTMGLYNSWLIHGDSCLHVAKAMMHKPFGNGMEWFILYILLHIILVGPISGDLGSVLL